jgi:NDP-sugar pyrophosphorylase family protein
MGLIGDLLPDFADGKIDDAPELLDEEAPWSILSDNSNDLAAQIRKMEHNHHNSFIHPTAIIGEFVAIEGPCFIGKNVEIKHAAFIRKGSWICEGAMVGHSSEIKNSILFPGAKVPHFNYVGDSIIGSRVNLGAGAKISNVRNDGREIILEMRSGRKVDSGLSKLGAIIGDDSRIGCNVVTNPGTIIEPGAEINPNSTVKGFFSSGKG